MTEDRAERVSHSPRVREAIDELMREKDATDNRTTELLPCPFCGGEAAIVPTLDTTVREWFVTCGNLECNVLACHTKRYYTEAEAIAAWNTRATHGTLTAEQVREAIRANSWAETSTILEFNDSSWQAIADELNACAERTCRIVEYDEAPIPVCSECGAVQPDDYAVYFCWSCGAKVRNA